MNKVDRLRKKYPRFIYEGYYYNVKHYKVLTKSGSYKIFKNDGFGKLTTSLKISFDFKIQSENSSRSISFKPEIIVKNIDRQNLSIISDKLLDNLVFHLGLMEIPSYWKTTCSPEIEIKAGYLDKQQIKWWKDFILNGMGQFFYENQIDFTKSNFLKITFSQQRLFGRGRTSPNLGEVRPRLVSEKNNKYLIPMGEGKDSIVTLELLKKFDKISVGKKSQIDCFVVNPTKEHFKILKIAGIKNPVIVERKVDPTLPKLNQKGACPEPAEGACPEPAEGACPEPAEGACPEPAEGFLNGHTPITAVISNLAVFCAVLFGFKSVVMSCERSSNEGNIKYLGKMINHQWSKSFEFEEKFRYYSKKYLAKEVEYFSFLRPLYEIQIAKIFSQFPEYFPVFLSCNEARKTNSWTKKPTGKWCGRCSKCLFIWTILYPFVKEKELIKIFGKNLFERKELLPIMKELIGDSETKPFECVGTKKECLIAFYLSYKKYIGDTYINLPFLLRYFEKKVLPKYSKLKLEQDSKKILKSWDKNLSLRSRTLIPKGNKNLSLGSRTLLPSASKQNNLPKVLDRDLWKAYHK